jgi:hypothetical protein
MALRAHFDQASGLPGPQPFVSFRFFLYTDDIQPFGGLSHQILVHAMIAESTVPIGPAYLPGEHRFERAGSGTSKQVMLVLPIDFATLRWIEEQRSGHGGVSFYFDWNVLGQREGPGEPLRNEPVSLAIGGTPFPVNLPQETWLQILHDVRYREVAIVEIPLIQDPQNPLARSHEHLETARERLYRADDRGVLVACGEAMDVLANARRIKLSKEYGYEHLIQDLLAPIFESDRKADRLGKVMSGVRQMCLSGKHDEASFEGRPIPVDHNDAVLAFLMTSAAISYLEQLPLSEQTQLGAAGAPRTRRRSHRRPAEGASTPSAAPVEAKPPEAGPPPAPVTTPDGATAPRPRRRRSRRSPRPEGSGGEQLPAAP